MAELTKLEGWGRYPVIEGVERRSEDLESITGDACLTRGLGRSYGDCSLPRRAGATVANARLANRILGFDPETGVLRAEAGLALSHLEEIFLPRGWSSPVSPGTEHVTLGGMVACDVHGKNHHGALSFGEHVRALRMQLADGRVLEVTEDSEGELFRATLGGLGLTGHILEVEVQLEPIPSPWIVQEAERVDDMDELVARLHAAGREWPFTVAWLDAVGFGGRLWSGVLLKARWAEPDEAPAEPPRPRRGPTIPIDAPSWLLGRATIGPFNLFLRTVQLRNGRRVVHPSRYFHPLDMFHDWNRAYGRRGFTQYQPVIPFESDLTGLKRLQQEMAASGQAPLLCVLKDLGAAGRGMISFPRPGLTISLDLPVRGERTRRLVNAMNEVVVESGGRVYLAKDAFTSAEHLRRMDPRLEAFREVREKWDPEHKLASALSVRLFGDAP